MDELAPRRGAADDRGHISATALPAAFVVVLMALVACSLGKGAAHAGTACAGMRFTILTPPLDSTPYVVLAAGGKAGPWLVDFGSTITSVYADSWKPPDPATLFAFDLPGAGLGARTLPVVEGGRLIPGVGRALGILGTDVLKTVTTEFHFEDGTDPHLIFRDAACARAAPGREGYVRIGQTDVFSAHPEAHASNLPNVPVVSVELEERPTDRQRPRLAEPKRSPRTSAQLDTGYADTFWPYSVDINEPYLAQLKRAVPSLTLTGLVPVSGCGREDTLREVYVAPGWRLLIVPDPPQRPIPFEGFHLIVKSRMTECGGIGPMPVPAAQLGASFLRAFRTTLIIPDRAEVWIKR